MIIGMNLAVKVLGLTPDQGRTDSRFDGKDGSFVKPQLNTPPNKPSRA